jgi:hypothetical protein
MENHKGNVLTSSRIEPYEESMRNAPPAYVYFRMVRTLHPLLFMRAVINISPYFQIINQNPLSLAFARRTEV